MMPFLLVGPLLVALALPLILRKVPPNPWYGLRVAATFADKWVWYEANARSGRDFLILGVVQTATALFAPTAVNIAVLVVGTIICAVVGMKRAKRLLREGG